MTGAPYPREALTGLLQERLRRGPASLLAGPLGAGKTTLLARAADALTDAGWSVVSVDLLGAASSPERFARAAVEALPARVRAAYDGPVTRVLEAAGRGKTSGAEAVQAVFDLWAVLDEADGAPVALLLDEPTEIRSLAYFAALREVDAPFFAALAARTRGTLLATSYGTASRRLWPALPVVECALLSVAEVAVALELARVRADPGAVRRGTGGWPRGVDGLVAALHEAGGVETAWARAMAPGGTLERACRHTYEVLLLRSRGYGMSKAVLQVVAEEEGLNLTAIVGRLGRTPGAVRDYLGWLLAVDALAMTKKRYAYVDPLLRWWVRLHGRGRAPREGEIRAAAREACAAAGPDAGDVGADAAEAAAAVRRREGLIEID